MYLCVLLCVIFYVLSFMCYLLCVIFYALSFKIGEVVKNGKVTHPPCHVPGQTLYITCQMSKKYKSHNESPVYFLVNLEGYWELVIYCI